MKNACWLKPEDLCPGGSNLNEQETVHLSLPPTVAGENANAYAHRALGALIARSPPDFTGRLRMRASAGRVRMLSICSGAARIEAQFIAAANAPVELTLVDINRDLLEQAARQMPSNAILRLVQADVNRLPPIDDEFDIAVCVSGLHHLVELEHVLAVMSNALKRGGEFWSVGEQVGRNGSRLWPDDYRFANAIFRELPVRYRKNRNSRSVDNDLPNKDCSAGCFEGIRS